MVVKHLKTIVQVELLIIWHFIPDLFAERFGTTYVPSSKIINKLLMNTWNTWIHLPHEELTIDATIAD